MTDIQRRVTLTILAGLILGGILLAAAPARYAPLAVAAVAAMATFDIWRVTAPPGDSLWERLDAQPVWLKLPIVVVGIGVAMWAGRAISA